MWHQILESRHAVSEDEDSDYGAERIFCYNAGGVSELLAAGGGEDRDEDAVILNEENS